LLAYQKYKDLFTSQVIWYLTVTIIERSYGLYLLRKRSGKLSITAEAATQISGYIG